MKGFLWVGILIFVTLIVLSITNASNSSFEVPDAIIGSAIFSLIGGSIYLVFRYVVPFLWQFVIMPLARVTIFVAILLFAAVFLYTLSPIGQATVDKTVQIFIGTVAALYGAYKWTKTIYKS